MTARRTEGLKVAVEKVRRNSTPQLPIGAADPQDDLGYAAIEAADGASGLKVLQSEVYIDLLVTGVGLPGGMNGRQIADAAKVPRPDLKVLFITGYAENAALNHGHLSPGMEVLRSPSPRKPSPSASEA